MECVTSSNDVLKRVRGTTRQESPSAASRIILGSSDNSSRACGICSPARVRLAPAGATACDKCGEGLPQLHTTRATRRRVRHRSASDPEELRTRSIHLARNAHRPSPSVARRLSIENKRMPKNCQTTVRLPRPLPLSSFRSKLRTTQARALILNKVLTNIANRTIRTPAPNWSLRPAARPARVRLYERDALVVRACR